MLSATIFRRKELVAAGIAFVVAIMVAIVVIPPVLADTSPMAAPESTASFWVVGVIANAILGAAMLIATFLMRRARTLAQALAGIAGLTAFVVGLLLLMPVGAFASHGPTLASASIAMAVGAAGDFAASALALSAAGVFQRFGPAMRLLGQNVRTHRRAEALFVAL